MANRTDTQVSSPKDNFSGTCHNSNQNLKERTLANISHMTQSYCWNNFVIVRDNLKVKIRLDLILKQDVKLILSPNPTITFELTDVRFIGTFTILEC